MEHFAPMRTICVIIVLLQWQAAATDVIKLKLKAFGSLYLVVHT